MTLVLIPVRLATGVRVGSALVSVSCFLNIHLLSVNDIDSLQYVSVYRELPLSTVHVLTDIFSLGSLTVISLKYNTLGPAWF